MGDDEDGDLRLELQALPTQAKYLQKANLKGENSVSILLGEFPLATMMFNSNSIGSPVPLFFSPYPAAATSYLGRNPEIAKTDIGRINNRFLRMEHLSLTEAVSYLAKKHRAAKGTTACPVPRGPQHSSPVRPHRRRGCAPHRRAQQRRVNP